MKVTLAKTAGFCFGTKRAVEMVREQIKNGGKVYTFGPIIHNEVVVGEFASQGVEVINGYEELDKVTEGTIIIRSHGVQKKFHDILSDRTTGTSAKVRIVDATCPFVLKIHKTVDEKSKNGYHIIVVGDSGHPEVEGIVSWCNGRCTVVDSEEEAMNFSAEQEEKLCIVAQTTYKYKKFQDLVEIFNKKGYDSIVLNTICNATEERQAEACELAGCSDAMIVIGGKQSSNTKKLFEISKTECADTYYIQTLSDLDLKQFKSFRSVGITAGASTPNNIIKEVYIKMSEASFDELLEESFVTIHSGEIVEGTVIGVKEDEIAMNIGYKADGIITRSEFTSTPNVDLRTLVKEGDKLTVKVVKVNDGEGQVALSYRKLASERGNKRIEEAFENKEVLKAKVAKVLDGGLSVVVEEVRIFIPASLISDTYEKDLEKYKDQEIEFVITEFNPKRRRIIGDRKQLVVEQKKQLQKELFDKIKVGDVIEGTIKNVVDFGAFVDMGGADGLLHISEISWGRIENPKKLFKTGDKVRAFIKEINGEKIALSMKFPEENPWADAENKFAVGNVVTGVVARMTDFGAFVELEKGVDALLHVSQISKEHIEKPSSVLSIGQEITAQIVDFNYAEKKISLSVKALMADEEETVAEAIEE